MRSFGSPGPDGCNPSRRLSLQEGEIARKGISAPLLGQSPKFLAPSAGLEPAHTAPEADALSAELRGRATGGKPVAHDRSFPSRSANCSATGPARDPGHTAGDPATTYPRITMSTRDHLAQAVSTRRRHRGRTGRARPRGRSRLGPPRAPGPPRARGLVDQRRHGHRQAGRDQPAGPGHLAGGGARRRPARSHRLHRDRRPRLHQLPSGRRMAPRRPVRAARRRGGGLRPARRGPRRAGPGRVHLGQPDRPDPRGQRLVGQLRRLPGPGAGPRRLPGEPRVLRQRHRRADQDPGGEPAGPPPRGAGARRAATRAST